MARAARPLGHGVTRCVGHVERGTDHGPLDGPGGDKVVEDNGTQTSWILHCAMSRLYDVMAVVALSGMGRSGTVFFREYIEIYEKTNTAQTVCLCNALRFAQS